MEVSSIALADTELQHEATAEYTWATQTLVLHTILFCEETARARIAIERQKHINQLFCDIAGVTSNQKSEYEKKSTVNSFSWLVTGFSMAESEMCDWWLRIGNVTKCEGLFAVIDARWSGNKSIMLSRLDLIMKGSGEGRCLINFYFMCPIYQLKVSCLKKSRIQTCGYLCEIMNEIWKSNNLSDQYCP